MIIDNIENISKYCSLPCQREGDRAAVEGFSDRLIQAKVISFLKNLSSDTPVGHYEIDEGIYANVDQYIPKNHQKCRFEAHKKYIDIQMMLYGEENLEYTTTDGLEISEEYDENRDVMFFENTTDFDTVKLTPFKFAFIFPHEAHKPQIKTTSDLVKKVVVKIKVL